MRDVRDDVEPRDALLFEQRHGERVALGEDGDEHVRARDLFLAARLHVHDGAPDRALHAERRRGRRRRVLRDRLDLLVRKSSSFFLSALRIAARVTDDVRRRLVEQERVEQVLDRHVLVPSAGRVVGGDDSAISTSGLILILLVCSFGSVCRVKVARVKGCLEGRRFSSRPSDAGDGARSRTSVGRRPPPPAARRYRRKTPAF